MGIYQIGGAGEEGSVGWCTPKLLPDTTEYSSRLLFPVVLFGP